MNKYNKLLTSISICFMLMLFVTFVLTCVGLIDLRIVGEFKFTPAQTAFGNFVMFMINMFFMFSISLQIFDRRIIIILIAYIPIVFLTSWVPLSKTFWLSGLIPSIYIISIALLLFRSKFNKILIFHGFMGITTAFYQQISGFIKLSNFGFDYYMCNIATMFIYSIDLYLFYILLYWGVKNYVAKHPGEVAFRILRLLKGYRKEILTNYRQNKEDASDLTERQRRVFCLLVWIYLIIQSFIVLGTNIIINKFLFFLGGFYIGIMELVIAWIALELFRISLGKSFHSINPIICNAVSIIVFFVISRLGLPLHASLFFNIAVVALIAYIIHIMVVKYDDYEKVIDNENKELEPNNEEDWTVDDVISELKTHIQIENQMVENIRDKEDH